MMLMRGRRGVTCDCEGVPWRRGRRGSFSCSASVMKPAILLPWSCLTEYRWMDAPFYSTIAVPRKWNKNKWKRKIGERRKQRKYPKTAIVSCHSESSIHRWKKLGKDTHERLELLLSRTSINVARLSVEFWERCTGWYYYQVVVGTYQFQFPHFSQRNHKKIMRCRITKCMPCKINETKRRKQSLPSVFHRKRPL